VLDVCGLVIRGGDACSKTFFLCWVSVDLSLREVMPAARQSFCAGCLWTCHKSGDACSKTLFLCQVSVDLSFAAVMSAARPLGLCFVLVDLLFKAMPAARLSGLKASRTACCNAWSVCTLFAPRRVAHSPCHAERAGSRGSSGQGGCA